MTKKQIKTILLFAQNYSLPTIAKKQEVSLATIRERIKGLSKNHYREFNNALALRESHKRIRDGLRNPASLDSLLIAQKAKEAAKEIAFGRDMDDIREIF